VSSPPFAFQLLRVLRLEQGGGLTGTQRPGVVNKQLAAQPLERRNPGPWVSQPVAPRGYIPCFLLLVRCGVRYHISHTLPHICIYIISERGHLVGSAVLKAACAGRKPLKKARAGFCLLFLLALFCFVAFFGRF
jgi:hypothetical protein